MMKAKKWCISVLIAYVCILILIGILVYVVDPYFHYHMPLKSFSHKVDKEVYMNDGIIKNYNYNAIIAGTSTTLGLHEEEANKLFGRKFIRVSYPGEGFKRVNEGIDMAISLNPDLDFVIRGVDPLWFISDPNYMGYEDEGYPEYLYDDIMWNDVNYLFNRDILEGDVIPLITKSLDLQTKETLEVTNFTENTNSFLDGYERVPREIKTIDQSETDMFFNMLEENLDKNILNVIADNPNVEFYIFFPPYSICWWDGLNQNGIAVLERRLDMEKYVIEKILEYDNVHLFSFFENYELICNLDNYIDDVHFNDDVSSQILIWMKEGKYELTKENYLDYLSNITEFYSNYDYDSLYKQDR